MKKLEQYFKLILEELNIELPDTPLRMATFFKETFYNKEDLNVSTFNSENKSKQLIISDKIKICSFCEHHLLPMIGTAQIAYIPEKKIIGFSSINKVLHFFAKKPQLQERYNEEVTDYLSKALGTKNVAILTKLEHLCVSARAKESSGIITSWLSKGSIKIHDIKTN